MALLLPILQRAATAIEATGMDAPDCGHTRQLTPTLSAASLASTSASGEIHFSVKNTFIDVSPAGSEGGRAGRALHDHGARTCLARIASSDSPQQLLGRTRCVELPTEANPVVFTPTPRFHAHAAD